MVMSSKISFISIQITVTWTTLYNVDSQQYYKSLITSYLYYKEQET